MEKYMGYRSADRRPAVNTKGNDDGRDLPVFKIGGTDFTVDLAKHELRQTGNPYNRITLGNVKEEMGFAHFLYDNQTKNIYLGDDPSGARIPEHVSIVLLPPLKDLDPVGLARRHGLPDDFYGGKALSAQQQLTEFTKQKSNAVTSTKIKTSKTRNKKRRAKRKGV